MYVVPADRNAGGFSYEVGTMSCAMSMLRGPGRLVENHCQVELIDTRPPRSGDVPVAIIPCTSLGRTYSNPLSTLASSILVAIATNMQKRYR
jgi:hypothetical protein